MADIEIRRLRPEEWERYRTLRLTALSEAPHAFSSTLSEEERLPEERWRQWAKGTIFIAVEGDWWIGMIGAYPDEDPHVVVVWGMWVHPDRRRSGVGQRLLGAVIDWARTTPARRLRLGVTETNEAAVRFYRANGFIPTGARQFLRSDPSLTEMEMGRDLTS